MSSSNNKIYKKTSFLAGTNSSFIEEYYSQYLSDPNSLSASWKLFFDGLNENKDIINKNFEGPSWRPNKIKKQRFSTPEVSKNGKSTESPLDVEQLTKDSVRAIMLIRAYRIRGHLIANLDPLNLQQREEHPELKPETYGFKERDLDRKLFLDGVLGLQNSTLREVISILKKTYCSKIGYEYMHMSDPEKNLGLEKELKVRKKMLLLQQMEKKQF